MVTFTPVKSARGDLISAGIPSGVKRARLQHRLLYGTREVAIVSVSVRTIDRVRITRDSSDGLSSSNEEVAERQWSEGLSLFGFIIFDNQSIWDDRLL